MYMVDILTTGGTIIIVTVAFTIVSFVSQKTGARKEVFSKTGRFRCGVCGYLKQQYNSVCSCCGNRSKPIGNLSIKEISVLRKKFRESGFKWNDEKLRPKGWDVAYQIGTMGCTIEWFGREQEYCKYLRQKFVSAAREVGIEEFYILEMYDDAPFEVEELSIIPQSGTLVDDQGRIYKYNFYVSNKHKSGIMKLLDEIDRDEINDADYRKAMASINADKSEIIWYEEFLNYINQDKSSMAHNDRLISKSVKERVKKNDAFHPDLNKMLEENEPNIVERLYNYIGVFSVHGEEFGLSPAPQKNLYLAHAFYDEVNNGGFYQYFFNSIGMHAHETVKVLEGIGADEAANLLQKAIEQFPDSRVPQDRAKRVIVLEKISKRAEKVWRELEFQFDDSRKKELAELNLEYVIKHKDSF